VVVRPLVKMKIASVLCLSLLMPRLGMAQSVERQHVYLETEDTTLYRTAIFPLEPLHLLGDLRLDPIKDPWGEIKPIESLNGITFSFHRQNGHSVYQVVSVNKQFHDSLRRHLINHLYCDYVGFTHKNDSLVFRPDSPFYGGPTKYTSLDFSPLNRMSKQNPDWNHSSSAVDTFWFDGRERINIYFKGIDPLDRPCFDVLSKILKQNTSSFQVRFVTSGLSREAQVIDNPMLIDTFICFQIFPNPFGIKESIEAFFKELYAMPLFDYTTKEQLELAKEQIAIEKEISGDRFVSQAIFESGFYAQGLEEFIPAYLDSVNAITKVDLMNFIRKYFHEQPFKMHVLASKQRYEEVCEYVKSTKPIESYIPRFKDERAAKWTDSSDVILDELTYILNLTSWAPVEVHLYGNKKRLRSKREKHISDYFLMASVDNPITFVYHRNSGELIECATFNIKTSND